MTNILHITYDLRDRLLRDKTDAVKNLIEITSQIGTPSILDLVRVPNFSEEMTKKISDNHLFINSFGLPYGILLLNTLKRVVNKIEMANNSNLFDLRKVDLIHAHKLTFEGYIGFKIAKSFNKPLVITLRQTDTYVLLYKPHLINIYKKILEYSKVIYYVNPYSLILLKKRLGSSFYGKIPLNKFVLLPNIVEREQFNNNKLVVSKSAFLTIFRMDKQSVKRKNIKRLLKAFSLIADKEVTLNIIGSGDYENTVRRWVKNFGLNSRITFLGKIPNKDIDRYFKESAAFLLPSISETFGLVYAEALLNRTPILYSKNRLGFDGFFENVGPAVNPTSVESIRQGIIDCIENNLSYRQTINELSSKGEFKIFNRDNVKKKYFDSLKRI